MEEPTIRDATTDDADACAAIYGHYVRTTPATFELEPPSVQDVRGRIAGCQASHAWLVAVRDGAVTGFAYGTRFAERPAYRWSCEISVYLDPERIGSGTGSALYDELLARLVDRGLQVAYAGSPSRTTRAMRCTRGSGSSGSGCCGGSASSSAVGTTWRSCRRTWRHRRRTRSRLDDQVQGVVQASSAQGVRWQGGGGSRDGVPATDDNAASARPERGGACEPMDLVI